MIKKQKTLPTPGGLAQRRALTLRKRQCEFETLYPAGSSVEGCAKPLGR